MPFSDQEKNQHRCKSTSKLCLFHTVTVALKIPSCPCFLRPEQAQACSSFAVSTGFQKTKHKTTTSFRLLLKILAGNSDLSSYSAKTHSIKRKIRNNVAFNLTAEKLNTSL